LRALTVEIIMRKVTLLSVAGIIALGLAAPGVAQQNNTQARQSAEANGGGNTGDPNRTICVRADLSSGTRITRRVCRTAREWEAEGGVPR
jgi:hypothetical protein